MMLLMQIIVMRLETWSLPIRQVLNGQQKSNLTGLEMDDLALKSIKSPTLLIR